MNDLSLIIDKIIKERDLYYKRGLELASYPHQSPKTEDVFAAFSQAQGEFPKITKDTQGYGYKYADLSKILSTITPILGKHGLHITQFITRNDMLHTRIGHSSGQYFESQCKLPNPPADTSGKRNYMQELGSQRTYIRRYEILALLGINPEGDDQDGK